MTKLSVNVNKLATLRNSRKNNNPDVLQMAQKIIQWGAHGITVHPRPDGRHILPSDVLQISSYLQQLNSSVEFNIEGYPSENFLELAKKAQPDQCTLVPDPPDVLTSNQGWVLAENTAKLQEITQKLKKWGIRVSIFLDPLVWNSHETEALKVISPCRIEMYTKSFASAFTTPQLPTILESFQKLAQIAQEFGVGLNAGHDLDQKNLHTLVETFPLIEEVSIGHALICEALLEGMETTVKNYLRILGWV